MQVFEGLLIVCCETILYNKLKLGEILVILHKYKEMEMPMQRSAYLKRVNEDTVRNNPNQPEFLQAVGEVIVSLET